MTETPTNEAKKARRLGSAMPVRGDAQWQSLIVSLHSDNIASSGATCADSMFDDSDSLGRTEAHVGVVEGSGVD